MIVPSSKIASFRCARALHPPSPTLEKLTFLRRVTLRNLLALIWLWTLRPLEKIVPLHGELNGSGLLRFLSRHGARYIASSRGIDSSETLDCENALSLK